MANVVLDNFTPDELAVIDRLDLERLPRHVAVIMDGNGRWATQQGLPRVIGHHAGVESIRALIRASQDLGIGYLTLYSFSTENWARPSEEVQALMALIEQQFKQELDGLHRENVRILHLGRTEGLPDSLRATLCETVTRTAGNTALTVVFAINYSGRAELRDAACRLMTAARAGTLDPANLREEDMADALYLPHVPAPDLLIRTGGEMRISNYLLWQIAYAEFWFSPVLWPEFRAIHLVQALEDYQQRQRKFGRITS